MSGEDAIEAGSNLMRDDESEHLAKTTREQLLKELDEYVITSENIGAIRAKYLISVDSEWNSFVLDETAKRENKPKPGGAPVPWVPCGMKSAEEGYLPCTRTRGHVGGCTHPKKPYEPHRGEKLDLNDPAVREREGLVPLPAAPVDGRDCRVCGEPIRPCGTGWLHRNGKVGGWNHLAEPAFGNCSGCGVAFTEAGGLPGNLCTTCRAKKLQKAHGKEVPCPDFLKDAPPSDGPPHVPSDGDPRPMSTREFLVFDAARDYVLNASKVAPGTDLSIVLPGAEIREGDIQSNANPVPAEWVGTTVKAVGFPVFRPVPLYEPPGAEGPTGIPGPPDSAYPAGLIGATRRLSPMEIIQSEDLSENSSGVIDTVPSVWVGQRAGNTEIWRANEAAPPSDNLRAGECTGAMDGIDTCGTMAPEPWISNWDRLLRWLFPDFELKLPQAPPDWPEVIHLDIVTMLSPLDRLRILVSGRMHTRALLVCEREAGKIITATSSAVLAPGRGKP